MSALNPNLFLATATHNHIQLSIPLSKLLPFPHNPYFPNPPESGTNGNTGTISADRYQALISTKINLIKF